MFNRLKAFIIQKLPQIVFILLVIMPPMDVLSYFLSESGSNLISTLLRFFILGITVLLGFTVSEKKIYYFIFYGAVALFWILHAANLFRVGYISFVEDTTNFLRIMNLPIYTLSFVSFFKKRPEIKKSLVVGVTVNFLLVLLFTVLPWALGDPQYTYEGLVYWGSDMNNLGIMGLVAQLVDFKLTGLGVMGWFAVHNAQSAIIVLLTPLMLFFSYKTKKPAVFAIAMLLAFGLMYFTGTKFTYYSIFIIAAAFIFLFAVNLKKKSVAYIVPIALVLLVAVALKNVSPMQIRENMSDYARENYSELVEDSVERSGNSVSQVSRLKDKSYRISDEERLRRLRAACVGFYTDSRVYGDILKDMNGRFGVYNVMEAYGYTYETSVLSDSRVRKSIFAKLVFNEKDFATKLLGFEYSDMLAGKENYDLENDFPAVFYFCGYIGFALYMLYFVYFAFIILRKLFCDICEVAGERPKSIKKTPAFLWHAFSKGIVRFLNVEMGVVGMTFLLALIAAQISGNVLRRPNVTVYFAVMAAYIHSLCSGYRLRAKGANNTETTENRLSGE